MTSTQHRPAVHALITPLATPQDPVDVDTIRESLAEAEKLHGLNATDAELQGVAELLRGHIAELLPDAEAVTDALWHGSLEWSRRSGRLSGIRFQSEQGLGAGTLSAHVQVSQLGRDCRWLLDDYLARDK